MPAKKHKKDPATLTGPALVKETARRIRVAMRLWDAHRNAACREERKKALALYDRLTPAQREQLPQQLKVWLRFRSEKYFGQTKSGGNGAHEKVKKAKRTGSPTPPRDGRATEGSEGTDDDDEWAGVGL